MNFLKALWRSIVPSAAGHCDTPSQHTICPQCNAPYKSLNEFEQEHSDFEEGDSPLEMTYTCGRCMSVSQWYLANVPVFRRMVSYGVTMRKLQQDIIDHFKYWAPTGHAPRNLLYFVTGSLRKNTNTLHQRSNWDLPEHAETFIQGCAVDYILYSLLLTAGRDVCHDLQNGKSRFSLSSTSAAIEIYFENLGSIHRTRDPDMLRLIEEAESHVGWLEAACRSSDNVPMVFVEPIIDASAAQLMKVGLLMLQVQEKKHFHSLVYERLRHFVHVSS